MSPFGFVQCVSPTPEPPGTQLLRRNPFLGLALYNEVSHRINVMSHILKADEEPISLRQLVEPLLEPLKKNWKLAVGTILCGWAKFTLPMGVPLIIGHIIDHVLLQPADDQTATALIQLAGLALVIIALVSIVTYYRFTMAHLLSSRLEHHLRKRLFHHIQNK